MSENSPCTGKLHNAVVVNAVTVHCTDCSWVATRSVNEKNKTVTYEWSPSTGQKNP